MSEDKKKKKKIGRVDQFGCLELEYAKEKWKNNKKPTLEWYKKERMKALSKYIRRPINVQDHAKVIKELVKEEPKKSSHSNTREEKSAKPGLLAFQNFMKQKKLKRGQASKQWSKMTDSEKRKYV